jgi:hypothetical protein
MDTPRGTTALKIRYLGGSFVGQELCWCRISIAVNAVHITRYFGWRQVYEYFEQDPGRLFLLKEKLRAYVRRKAAPKRWRVIPTRYGAEMVIYYPSVSWLRNTGTVEWMNDGSF